MSKWRSSGLSLVEAMLLMGILGTSAVLISKPLQSLTNSQKNIKEQFDFDRLANQVAFLLSDKSSCGVSIEEIPAHLPPFCSQDRIPVQIKRDKEILISIPETNSTTLSNKNLTAYVTGCKPDSTNAALISATLEINLKREGAFDLHKSISIQFTYDNVVPTKLESCQASLGSGSAAEGLCKEGLGGSWDPKASPPCKSSGAGNSWTSLEKHTQPTSRITLVTLDQSASPLKPVTPLDPNLCTLRFTIDDSKYAAQNSKWSIAHQRAFIDVGWSNGFRTLSPRMPNVKFTADEPFRKRDFGNYGIEVTDSGQGLAHGNTLGGIERNHLREDLTGPQNAVGLAQINASNFHTTFEGLQKDYSLEYQCEARPFDPSICQPTHCLSTYQNNYNKVKLYFLAGCFVNKTLDYCTSDLGASNAATAKCHHYWDDSCCSFFKDCCSNPNQNWYSGSSNHTCDPLVK